MAVTKPDGVCGELPGRRAFAVLSWVEDDNNDGPGTSDACGNQLSTTVKAEDRVGLLVFAPNPRAMPPL